MSFQVDLSHICRTLRTIGRPTHPWWLREIVETPLLTCTFAVTYRTITFSLSGINNHTAEHITYYRKQQHTLSYNRWCSFFANQRSVNFITVHPFVTNCMIPLWMYSVPYNDFFIQCNLLCVGNMCKFLKIY